MLFMPVRTPRRYVRLELPRLWTSDVLYFARKRPIMGGSFTVNVAPLVEARRTARQKVSWAAILVKAIGLVAAEHPELRRAFMPLLRPHLHESPWSVATIVVEREFEGMRGVFFDRIEKPETMSLHEIEARLRGMKTVPVGALGGYRLLIRVTRYPKLLRRLLWRLALYGSGRLRCKYFGTFSVNAIPAKGVATIQATTLLATSFYYGPIDASGGLPLQVFFDHDVVDGMEISRMVSALGSCIRKEILAELNGERPAARPQSQDPDRQLYLAVPCDSLVKAEEDR